MKTEVRRFLLGVALMTALSGSASAGEEEHRHKEPAVATNPSGDTGQHMPDMHMHKSDITHAPDAEAANDFRGEASQLRAQAESHRKLAKHYASRTSNAAKGAAVNYANVAKHCEGVAKAYEDAAKAAEAAAAELSK